jgi:hypothetical protein
MKTSFFIVALLFLAVPVLSQNPTVQIKLNDEERFRFDSIQLIFVNPSHHVMIGDSVGMNDTANANTEENTFLGFKAGAWNRGGWNTFLGTRAGEGHTNGNDNVYLGGWAGRYDSTGEYNTYVGANAGLYNKTGDRNTFVGRNTGIFSDSSSSNTFIGYNSGYYHSGGMYNVFMGRNAGAYSGRFSAVSNNTYLGSYAGHNNIYGEGNVFIGYQAGMNDTVSSRLYIANTDTIPPLIYGEFDNGIVRLNVKRLELRNYGENTFVGDSTGVNNEGARNVFVGYHAGYSTTNSNDNIFIGDSAGYFTTTGRQNLFMGSWTGWSNTIGNSNVIMGYAAGIAMTEGSLNTMVGVNSGFHNTTGSQNVFLGVSAGASNTTGSSNTFLGRRAGIWSETVDSSVFIGYYAGAKEQNSHRLYIANSDTTTPLIYGEFENELLRVHGTLDIKGLYHFPIADGSNGQVLKTDGSGTLGWSSDAGATDINGLTDAKAGGGSVFLGPGAGGNEDGLNRWNVAVGHTSLLDNVSGMYNTAVGGQALMNSIGWYNTATGYQALFNNTVAGYNTAHGAWALYSNTSGGSNCASGYGALYTNGSGYYNTAAGTQSLYFNTADHNTALGCQSLYKNSTGEKGTAVGSTALMNNTTGNYNTAMGCGALNGLKGGHGNTAAGYLADSYNEYGSNNTILGYEAGRATSRHNKSGNVFIGYKAGYSELGDDRLYIANSDTTAPLIYGEFDNELLRVHGTLDIKGIYQFPITDGTNGQVLQTDGSGTLAWASAGGDFSNGGEAGGADRSLGNTDDYDLSLLTNNTQRLLINNDGSIRLDGNLGIFSDPDIPGGNNSIKLYDSKLYSNPYLEISGHNSAYLYLESRRSETTSGKKWSIASGSGSVADLDKFFIYNPDDGYCFTIRDGGNIGIGTTTPEYRLHVQSATSSHFQLKNTGDNEARIHLDANRNNSDNQVGIVEGRWNGTTVSQMVFYSGIDNVNKDEGYISFFTRSASLSERMRISQEGNVGVNTADPTAKMDINSSNGYDQLRLRSSFTPSGTSDASGDIGDVAWDDGYIYIKTSAGWKRTQLETF